MIIEQLPGYVLLSLTELGLILVGYLVERHYVSRITVFTNALALNVHLLSIRSIPDGFGLFADFSLLFALMMLGLYAVQRSAPGWVYVLAMYPMASIVIGTVILAPFRPWYLNLLLGIFLQVSHSISYNTLNPNGSLTYEGKLSGQISRFVDNAQITFNDRGITRKVDLAVTKIETTPWWLELNK